MIVAKRSKEEREEERKKELLRTLRRGPDTLFPMPREHGCIP